MDVVAVTAIRESISTKTLIICGIQELYFNRDEHI